MTDSPIERLSAPRQDDLGLMRIANKAGFSISRLPNGAIFAMEHAHGDRRIMVNQVLGSPVSGGMGRLYLRVGGPEPVVLPIFGPEVRCNIGAGDDCFVWEGETAGLRYEVRLWLHPEQNLWFWQIEIVNTCSGNLPCDVVFIQDIGLGDRGFLMSNEAYASQYLDHQIVRHPRMGPVLMSRQNLVQDDTHPWIMHGCLEGAAGFATDFRQIMGPANRDSDGFEWPFGVNLPSVRLQYETACAALQSETVELAAEAAACWKFFGLFQPDHPAASSDADLALIEDVERAAKDWTPHAIALAAPARSILQDAPIAHADALNEEEIRARYAEIMHVEQQDGRLLSFFVPGDSHSRHVVLRDKERMVVRRHGALLRSGADMLPDETTMCVTCWMHGVFGAQLSIGNTSFHQLFSISRDPYNINRGSGLRMLVDAGDGWQLLAVPSAFEIGLGDCRWIYRLGLRTIIVSAVISGDEPAMQWRVSVEGEPCRFLVSGHLTLGEREYAQDASFEIDGLKKRISFRPDEKSFWGQHYPQAVYHLVTGTPECIEIIGGDELLYLDGQRHGGAFAAMRTRATTEFAFAVVGSMQDADRAEALAARYAGDVDDAAMQMCAMQFWRDMTRGINISSGCDDKEADAIDTILPWLVHDAMVHLTVPHGLEQYTGAAWGTRDVCQGPIELFLTLEHDEPVKAILRVIFAEQYENQGDWPQWFMLEPYSVIRDKQAHGDVIIWPLKALCDYIEATGDFAFLDEPVCWRREDNLKITAHADPIAVHIDKLIATLRQSFIAGTHLIRYGNGDWNDSLQPVDPMRRDWMVSSWTVALLYEQLCRYAEILRRAGRPQRAGEMDGLASAMREDFNRFLISDGIVAGYGVFKLDGSAPDLLLHPSDKETGVSYSLLPMIQAISGGLFTQSQALHHLHLIRQHLAFADGARLMDRPMAYHGGLEKIFRRAESAAFFGREIGLMYVHSHLRYAEAMAVLGEAEALWDALIVANPIAVTERLVHASLRQRNAYFSSSDGAFQDRYQASAEWERVKAGTVAVDGGWRIYSSGSGLYINMLIRHALGIRRHFGLRIEKPCLPAAKQHLKLEWPARLGAELQQR